MPNSFSEFTEIIGGLIEDINKTKNIWGRLLSPGLDDHWDKKEASFWIDGTTEVSETIELEQWLFTDLPSSKIARSRAIYHFVEWTEHILENGVYADFSDQHLTKPEDEETLEDYIRRLACEVEGKGWGTKRNEMALKCFLAFLRNNKTEEFAFIDHIFPPKMDLHYDKIIRIVRPQVYPISQEIVASIIKELAYQCAYGRTNARHNAAEALALSWLCLASSRIRLPRSLESVHTISSKAIICKNDNSKLRVPSIFGAHEVRISMRVTKFLRAVASVPSPKPRNTILQTSLADLRKPFNAAIKKANLPKELGEITFLTFLSSPHHFGKNIR
jgi:hypothetical protein